MQVTSVNGPAMSDSMYAIGWLEVNRYHQAVASFQKMFAHIAGDFQVGIIAALQKRTSLSVENKRKIFETSNQTHQYY